jgi:hypothetical protein
VKRAAEPADPVRFKGTNQRETRYSLAHVVSTIAGIKKVALLAKNIRVPSQKLKLLLNLSPKLKQLSLVIGPVSAFKTEFQLEFNQSGSSQLSPKHS